MQEDMIIEDIGGVGTPGGGRGGGGGEEEEEEEEGGATAGFDEDSGTNTGEEEGGGGGASQEPPSSIIVTNLLTNTFDDFEERVVFESLFHDIDETATFQYFKSFRRVRVNFSSAEQAAKARNKLHMTEFREEIIKCYFTQPIVLGSNREGGPHLQPPKREKQFLISPPASPPVGWEPIDEAEPLINYDLIAAVANLAPGESHELHPPMEDKPGIIVHVCEETEVNCEGGAKPRIIQTRRPT